MTKILLSAFGCAPHRGSDAEVGWKWAMTLADLGHEVWMITREVNRQGIDAELSKIGSPSNLHFIYFEIPWFLTLTKGIYGRGYVYYDLWQWGAYRRAREAHQKYRFDVVHHVTWVSARQPSFMGNLGIPFYFGPVAGGERAPWRLRCGYSARQWAADIFRDFVNLLIMIDPLMWWTFAKAEKIYVTSEQTRRLLPRKFWKKTIVQLAIATDWLRHRHLEAGTKESRGTSKDLRILYVGRFIGWKGMHIGLRAFREVVARNPRARLTMVGRGPEEADWRRLATSLSLDPYIEWIPWTDRETLRELYMSHDIFLFPSLHESGGLVVLEALAQGLPVVCLDLGGPGMVVDASCGICVKAQDVTQRQVIDAVAESLMRIANDSQLRESLAKGATNRAKRFSWHDLASSIYEVA